MNIPREIRFSGIEPDDPPAYAPCGHCATPTLGYVTVVQDGIGPCDIPVCMPCYGRHYAPTPDREPTAADVPF